ncbi:MAG: glycosyltransferase family 9 protein [Acidobacteriaceae bacterium]|nr:glycosyltransferase family 9 protein [Acidobacteriaceae bacterium]
MRRLLIRPGGIGDCILSFPALQHLKADYTEIWIPSPIVPLITFAEQVRSLASTGIDIVGVGELEIPTHFKTSVQSFDSVVSWYGANRAEFREALLNLGVSCEFHPALPPPEYSGHATDFFSAQVGASLGLIPRIPTIAAASRNSVVIHPFSGSRRKNWPLHLYRELAAKLPLAVEWTAGPEEDLPQTIRFSSLADLAAWIAGSRLYIGNDSGITHLAAAIGVPTLAVFGPSSPDSWMPRGENVTLIRADRLEELSVQCVRNAANRLLDSL